MDQNESLRTILRANAAFAAATGTVALAATGPIAEAIGVSEHRLISAVGAILLAFAAQLMFVSALNGKLLRRSARMISASDFAWVAGTVAIITMADLRTQGDLILAGIAAIVGTFGVLQLRSAMGVVDDDGPQIVEITRTLRGSADEVWDVVTDHEAYGRVAPNLSKVEATGPNGPELTRRCWDTRGKYWDETCSLWDEGRRFIVDVDTDADDYPYPPQSLRGEWRVAQVDDSHTSVTIRFELRPNPGSAGAAFAVAMTTGAGPLVRRITNAWQDILTNRSVAV
jgi:hypothetical protein